MNEESHRIDSTRYCVVGEEKEKKEERNGNDILEGKVRISHWVRVCIAMSHMLSSYSQSHTHTQASEDNCQFRF